MSVVTRSLFKYFPPMLRASYLLCKGTKLDAGDVWIHGKGGFRLPPKPFLQNGARGHSSLLEKLCKDYCRVHLRATKLGDDATFFVPLSNCMTFYCM